MAWLLEPEGLIRSISETVDLLFMCRISIVYTDWCLETNKQKYPVSSSFVCGNALFVKGQKRMARLAQADQKTTITHTTTL